MANKVELYLDASDYENGAAPDYARGLRVCELSNFAIAGRIIEGRPAARPRNARLGKTWPVRKLVKWTRLLLNLVGRIRPYYERREIVEP